MTQATAVTSPLFWTTRRSLEGGGFMAHTAATVASTSCQSTASSSSSSSSSSSRMKSSTTTKCESVIIRDAAAAAAANYPIITTLTPAAAAASAREEGQLGSPVSTGTQKVVQETLLQNYQSKHESVLCKIQKRLSTRCSSIQNMMILLKNWNYYPGRYYYYDNDGHKNAVGTGGMKNSFGRSFHSGTRIMFQLPSPSEIHDIMFEGRRRSSSKRVVHGRYCGRGGLLSQQSDIISQFNHDSVGLTRPLPIVTQPGASSGGVPVVLWHHLSLDPDDHNIVHVTGGKQPVVDDWNQYDGNLYDGHDNSNKDDNDDKENNHHHHHDNHENQKNHDFGHIKDKNIKRDLLQKGWWPQSAHERNKSISMTMEMARQSSNEHHDGMDWKIKRYRKRIGYGEDCYNQVRDAALDWEFQAYTSNLKSGNNDACCKVNGDGDETSSSASTGNRRRPILGILRAQLPTNDVSNEINSLQSISASSLPSENINPNVHLICNHPCSPTHKKLVTYTQFNLVPFHATQWTNKISNIMSKILMGTPIGQLIPTTLYAVNPVRVVYDIVDEESPNGDLYTCTAYATLKGHLLRGEERVSVILRRNHSWNNQDMRQMHGFWLPHLHPSKKVYTSSGQLMRKGSNAGMRLDVGMATRGGYVDVEILSYSKPASSILGMMVWPFIGKKQDEFFRCQLDALEQVAIKSMQHRPLVVNEM